MPTTALRSAALCSVLFLQSACSDLSTPADLDREQIIAVRATPSILRPGARVVLDSLIAGPEGPIVGEEIWKLRQEVPGITLEVNALGQTTLVCEDEVIVTDDVLELDLAIKLADEQVLLAQKSVALARRDGVNPTIESLRIDGRESEEGVAVTLARGEIPISVHSPAATRVAWYTSLGEIRYYRDAETILEVLPEDLGEGWIAAVVRDEEGGVSWRSVHLQAE